MDRYITSLLYLPVLLMLQHNAEGNTKIDPLVDTKVGLIRGLRASDGPYSMFLGIPFGKVDHNNPFGAATPYPPFKEEFKAYDDSVYCPQIEEYTNTLVGTLECLHLNIYVPTSATSQNRLPVLVWIYGGAFKIGNAGRILYGPKYLVKNDVILVTVNYRLGPYGFMCLDTPEVPGNQGLKDQGLALKWIKSNIESFGGDVSQITVMGESAGGMSVGLHLISNQEKLFHKAILQSGTGLLPGYTRRADTSTPILLAEQLGFNTTNMTEALNFLVSADPLSVITASSKIDRFYPCVEKEFDNVEAFITDYPVNLKVSKVKEMPVLLGFNADEWHGVHAKQSPEFYENNSVIKERLISSFDFNKKDLEVMEETIRHFYIGDGKAYDNRFKLADFESDFLFVYPTVRSIDFYLENEAKSIYYYMFSYVGKRNWNRWHSNLTIDSKALHADEIGYLFDASFWKGEPSAEDQIIIDRMTTMWTNFVKHGDPTTETTELLPIKWEPITTKDSPHYFLDIDSQMALGKRPYHERTAFWDLFYMKNKELQKGYVAKK